MNGYLKSTVEWVGQDDPKGCAIACVAMLAGTTYQDAKAYFQHRQPDAGEKEIAVYDLIEYLKECGWEPCGYRTFGYSIENGVSPVDTSPLDGAEATIVVVLPTPQLAHAIVLLPDGTVFDPARIGSYQLSDCPKVECLRGFRRTNSADTFRIMTNQQ